VAALALGREHASPRRLAALALATGGTVLVLVGGDVGNLDALGVAMGLGTAIVYTGYILVADRALGDSDPLTLAAFVMLGGTVATMTVALAAGGLQLGVDPAGWGWLAGVALVSTVLAVSCFFAGLPLVGPAAASIISTAEPVVTVGLALLFLGEALGPAQVAGGVLVLGAVVVLQLGAGTVAVDAPPDHAAAATPARPLAGDPARG
jgi:drug/metabolite transporter (DMT)-like permease